MQSLSARELPFCFNNRGNFKITHCYCVGSTQWSIVVISFYLRVTDAPPPKSNSPWHQSLAKYLSAVPPMSLKHVHSLNRSSKIAE